MKKEKLIRLTLLLAVLMQVMVLSAQTVVLDAEIRPRTEFRDGYKTLSPSSQDPGVFTIQRTRFGMGYTSGVLSTQITLQDSRTFGQQASASSEATTGLYEAWAGIVLMPGGTLKVGRQALNYDDSRLFSASGWSNTGTAHDMMLFSYQLNEWKMDVGYALNNNSEISSETLYTNTVKYRNLLLVWLTKKFASGFNPSFIFVDEGVQDTIGVGTSYKQWNNHHAYTYGGNLLYTTPNSKLNVRLAGYFQSGKNAKGKALNGKMAAFKTEYAPTKTTAIHVGMDWFSGDGSSTDNKQRNFKKLYGSDHTFNGYMDYWNTPLEQGLLDYYWGLKKTLGLYLSIESGFHLFRTEKALSSGKKDLGSEVDVLMNYKMNPQIALQAGWCCYFKTDNTLIAKRIPSGTATNFPQWAYVMLTIKPTLYKN